MAQPAAAVSKSFFLRSARLVLERNAGLSSPVSISFRRTCPNHLSAWSSKKQWFSSYPPHQLVGMPSLSPVRVLYCSLLNSECNYRKF